MSSGGGERESLANLYRSALMSGAQAANLDARSDEAHVSNGFFFGNDRGILRRWRWRYNHPRLALLNEPVFLLPLVYAD
jgi:hypothetical protein